MKRQSPASRRRASARPVSDSFEKLENRQLMAVALSYDAAQKEIRITGDGANDVVEVRQVSPTDKRLVVTAHTATGPSHTVFDQAVKQIVFRGGAGDDYFANHTEIACAAYGESGNDTLVGGSRSDFLDGGSGNDRAQGRGGYDRYRSTTAYVDAWPSAGQYVINVENGSFAEGPYGSPQKDGWSCGPNSAYRFLQHYGKNVSLSDVRLTAQLKSINPMFGLGLTASRLREVIKSYGVDASVRDESSLDSMLGELAKGKPVIALLQVGTTTDKIKIGGVTVGTSTRPDLHWVFVNGYDSATSKIHYTDTDGKQYSASYTDFSKRWNWNPSSFNPAVRAALKAAGLKSRTFIV